MNAAANVKTKQGGRKKDAQKIKKGKNQGVRGELRQLTRVEKKPRTEGSRKGRGL